jgi:hypothetical protein
LAVAALAAALAVASAAGAPSPAEAQVPEPTQVSTGFKATLGLGLVGTELGFVIPALAGMNDVWPYIVFPAVGATGGALAGYFLIDDGGSAELSVAMLTIGMALVIPAMVATLALTAYDPDDENAVEVTADRGSTVLPEDYEVGGGTTGGVESTGRPPSEDGSGGAGGTGSSGVGPQSRVHGRRDARTLRARAGADAGTGLLRISPRGVFVGVPAIAAVPVHPLAELARMGLGPREQRAELRVSVLSMAF